MKHLVKIILSYCLIQSGLAFADGILNETETAYDWTGLYGGLNIGALNHTMNMTDIQATTFNATIQQATDPSFTAGFQLGFRRQLDSAMPSAVFGLELSGNFADATYNQSYGSAYSLYEINSKHSLKTLGLLELIGGISANKALLFLAAGASWTNVDGEVINVAGAPFFNSFSLNKKAFGWALGTGIEYAFSPKFSARFKVDVIGNKPYMTMDNTENNYQIANRIIQAALGLNYKFC